MTFTRNEVHTLILTGAGHLGCHMAMLVYPTAAIMLASQEGYPLEVVLGWSFWGYLLFGAGAVPVGLMADHFKARWMVRAGVIGIGPAMILVGLAEPGIQVALAMALVGAFASIYHPTGISLISRTVAHRGKALGVNGIVGNFGIAGAPVVASFCAEAWGWRSAYFIVGGFLFILGVVVSLFRIEESRPGEATRDEHHHEPSERLRLFFILVVAMTLGGLVYRASSVTQPAYFAQRVSFMDYGLVTTLVYLFATFGQYLGGHLADRFDLRYLYIGFHAVSLPFVFSMAVLSGLPLMGVAAIFLFFNLGMQPIENSLVARFTPDRWRSTGYGIKFTVTFSVGAMSVPAIKAIMTNYSLSTVFPVVGCVVTLIVITAGLLILRTRGQTVLNLHKEEADLTEGALGKAAHQSS